MNKKYWLAALLAAALGMAPSAPARAEEPAAESEFSVEEIEKAFHGLRQGTDARAVEKNLQLLEEAGKDAFPVLVKNLGSKIAASPRHFKSEIWEIDPKTHLLSGRRPLTLGDVAFQLIQNAVEENFPQKFKIFQVLTRENVAAWLEKNRFLSLYEMRSAAAREALEKVEKQHRAEPSEHTRDALRYMQGLVGRYSTGG